MPSADRLPATAELVAACERRTRAPAEDGLRPVCRAGRAVGAHAHRRHHPRRDPPQAPRRDGLGDRNGPSARGCGEGHQGHATGARKGRHVRARGRSGDRRPPSARRATSPALDGADHASRPANLDPRQGPRGQLLALVESHRAQSVGRQCGRSRRSRRDGAGTRGRVGVWPGRARFWFASAEAAESAAPHWVGLGAARMAATTRPTATWATPPSSRLRSAGHGAPTGMRPRRSAHAREARAAYRRAIKLEGIEGAAVDVQSERARPVHSSAR